MILVLRTTVLLLISLVVTVVGLVDVVDDVTEPQGLTGRARRP
jgi:hypothetical protein